MIYIFIHIVIPTDALFLHMCGSYDSFVIDWKICLFGMCRYSVHVSWMWEQLLESNQRPCYGYLSIAIIENCLMHGNGLYCNPYHILSVTVLHYIEKSYVTIYIRERFALHNESYASIRVSFALYHKCSTFICKRNALYQMIFAFIRKWFALYRKSYAFFAKVNFLKLF